MVKLFVFEVVMEIVLNVVCIYGGYGYLIEYDVEWYFCDLFLMIFGEGINEI